MQSRSQFSREVGSQVRRWLFPLQTAASWPVTGERSKRRSQLCPAFHSIAVLRECGMALELEDVPVHSLVPEPLRGCATADEYLTRLPEHDDDMAAQLAEASAAGECLRYVGAFWRAQLM